MSFVQSARMSGIEAAVFSSSRCGPDRLNASINPDSLMPSRTADFVSQYISQQPAANASIPIERSNSAARTIAASSAFKSIQVPPVVELASYAVPPGENESPCVVVHPGDSGRGVCTLAKRVYMAAHLKHPVGEWRRVCGGTSVALKGVTMFSYGRVRCA